MIPGGQWTGDPDPAVIRDKLMQFIYGPTGDLAQGDGITDIKLTIDAHRN